MRIATLATTRNPLRQPFDGGQESHTATLITALRRLGHQVRLYALEGTDPALADELVTYPELPRLSPVAAIDPVQPEPDFLSAQHALLGAIADIVAHGSEIDLVHNQTLNYLPLAMNRALPMPLITTLHTPPFPWLEAGVALGGSTARYVAVSRALAAQWTALPAAPTVIPNGVDVTAFPPGPGGDTLVWVGRMVPEKGADLAILAAREAGRPLQLLGPLPNPEWYRAVVEPLLGAEASYLGHLDHRATAEVVGSAGVLLMTSRWDEPFGLVTVEAALTGTPVVTVARGGLPEVVTPELGVAVPVHDSDQHTARALADAVPAALALDRHQVRRFALEHFSAERMAADYQAVFADLIVHPRAA